MVSLNSLLRLGRFVHAHTFLPYKLLCFILLSSIAMHVQSGCLPVSNWSNTDATALGGDPLGFMTVDNTPRLQLLNGTNTSIPVTWFGSPAIHPDGHWSVRVNIASYPNNAGAVSDFNDPVRLNSFSETPAARFLLKETDRWLFGTFRSSAQTALFNFKGYALYEGNIIEITGGTAPGDETGRDAAIEIFLSLIAKAKTLINSKCGITGDNKSPTIQLFTEKNPPFVSGAVNNAVAAWSIVFEDLDGITDIDFATLKIEKKLIEQDYEDISGVFMAKFLELLNNGNVTMERTDTRLTATFNTSYQQLRELIFEADGPPYPYAYAYDLRFTVSDTKGNSGVAMAPFWLGRSPNIWFSLKGDSPLSTEDKYILEIYDWDKKADLRWDTFMMTLDGIDFTGLFLDRVTKYMTLSIIKLEPTDLGLNVIFDFDSKELLCEFFFGASGKVGFHITDYHGYTDSFEYPLNCK